MSLREQLSDWQDWDGAGYELGKALGIFERYDWFKAKHLFWSRNPLGEGLHDCLEALVEAGVLIGDGGIEGGGESESAKTACTRFKWNPEFIPFDERTPLQQLAEGAWADE